jgi:transcriptional/translational regulatory protein YebC/TACO1
MEVEESGVIYDPNEDTKVPLDDEGAAKELSERFLDKLQDVQGIQGIYTNWSKGMISDEIWEELSSKVAV